uniref:Disease resistance protein winged helix domain-containing protein n=1 Tax=Brassica campestris TaxID=3711 RepID=M4FIB4_BRACM
MGKKMVTYCGGLPLAVKVLGGLLANKNMVEEWKRVDDNIQTQIVRIDDNSQDSVYRVLSMSYEDLPMQLKHCFLYLAHFPEDDKIQVRILYNLWEAEGIITSSCDGETTRKIGEEYIDELVRRNMVIAVKDDLSCKWKYCQMHDMMREVCLYKAKEENFLQFIEVPTSSTSTINAHTPTRARRLVVHGDGNAFDMLGRKNNQKARSVLGFGLDSNLWKQQKNPSIYVPSRRISSGTAAATLRYATAMRSYSTSFMEERDTFGPIQVSSALSLLSLCQILGSPDAETLQNFEIGDEHERMSKPIVCGFGVLKKCVAKHSYKSITIEFDVDEELEAMGKEMVAYCGGLPLAIKVLGGLLANKTMVEEWKRVDDNIQTQIVRIDDKSQDSVYRVLSMSYEDLPMQLKHCFLYLAHFPEDDKIQVERLYYYWEAEGIITSSGDGETTRKIGEDYIEELVRRNMVIGVKEDLSCRWEYCQMHDMMREVCLYKAKEENFLQFIEVPTSSTSTINAHTPTRSRRLAVYGGDTLGCKNNKKVRSVLGFGLDSNLWKQSAQGLRNLQSLRVLDLSLDYKNDSKGGRIPSSIGKLIHLRYLSLDMGWGTHERTEGLKYITSLKELEIIHKNKEWETKLVPGGESYHKVQHIVTTMMATNKESKPVSGEPTQDQYPPLPIV